MRDYQSFEELPVWQETKQLYNAVQDLLGESEIPLSTGFRDRLDRAVISASNCIAEAFERSSAEDLVAIVSAGRGSLGEVQSMIAMLVDRPGIAPYASALRQIRQLAETCSMQLSEWADDPFPFDERWDSQEPSPSVQLSAMLRALLNPLTAGGSPRLEGMDSPQ
ncbi:MAG TPA: four helix bundle protein [Verrucomicrobiae bacterium]|nr:four helix bundle protein [Verrucomicrobiae bacterium]